MPVNLSNHKRIHYYPQPSSLDEASSFIANSLLLSHGIRKDTIAIVRLKCCILIAPGDRIRQLRPDYETRIGWIKAVIRGKHRGLGATLISHEEFIEMLESYMNGLLSITVVYESPISRLHSKVLEELKKTNIPIMITYIPHNTRETITENILLESFLNASYTSSVVNILLDNILE